AQLAAWPRLGQPNDIVRILILVAAPEGIGLHCEIGARTRDPQRVSRLATAARKQHVDLDVTNIQIDKSTGGEDHRGKLAAGNASGPVEFSRFPITSRWAEELDSEWNI